MWGQLRYITRLTAMKETAETQITVRKQHMHGVTLPCGKTSKVRRYKVEEGGLQVEQNKHLMETSPKPDQGMDPAYSCMGLSID